MKASSDYFRFLLRRRHSPALVVFFVVVFLRLPITISKASSRRSRGGRSSSTAADWAPLLLSAVSMLPRNTAAGLLVGVAAGAGAGYLLFGSSTDRSGNDESNDPRALAARRRRRLLSLPLAPGAASSRHPALELGCPPADALREFPGFAVGWDARLRVPRWVAERISRESSRGGGDRSAHAFREDDGGNGNGNGGGRRRRGGKSGNGALTAAAVPAPAAEGRGTEDPEDPGLDPRWRSTNAHYLASGFDRGHCAPAADFKGDPQALEASFVLSNVAPQVGPGMNRDYWARFERFVKALATGESGSNDERGSGGEERDVVVFTGPLFLPRRIKPERGAPANAPRYEMRHPMLGDPPRLVAVPTHFYKVALVLEKKKRKGKNGKRKTGSDENGGGGNETGSENGTVEGGSKARAIGAWVMPNAAIPPETPLTVFCVPLSALEDAAGGRFFPGVFEEEKGGEEAEAPPSSSSAAAAALLAPQSSAAAVALAERLDAAALCWQARGRAAALEQSKNRKSVSATAEAAAALLPLAPKLAGLLGSGGDKKDEDSEQAGPSPPRASGGAAELLLNPLPSKQQREQQQQQQRRRNNASSSSSSRPPPPLPPAEPSPKWSWLFRNVAGGGGNSALSHICDVTECKLPAEDWYKSFPASGKK